MENDTGRPQRYGGLASRVQQEIEYRNKEKETHEFFGFAVPMKAVLTIYCSLFSVQ